MDACLGNSKKSGITNSRESIFYDLAECAPPNNPFDNSNPTTPRIGTNLLGSAAGRRTRKTDGENNSSPTRHPIPAQAFDRTFARCDCVETQAQHS